MDQKRRRWLFAICAVLFSQGFLAKHPKATSSLLRTGASGFLGFLSAVAQVILIREFMAVFSGHELVFAVVLAVWLLGCALGSALMNLVGLRRAVISLIAACVLLPITVIAARLLKPVMGMPLGVVPDMGVVAIAATVILLPLTFVLGGVFAVLAREARGEAVYGAEALGFAVGGILTACVILVPLPSGLGKLTVQAAWPGYTVVASEQTRYGALVMAERNGQKSFFENGRHLFTAGDAFSAEEVHIPLLVHPAPRNIFLIGGGFSQAGQEALKHPVDRVDYAELDPGVLRLEFEQVLFKPDARLHVMSGDPRAVLARSRDVYDVVVVNVGDPTTIFAGRFFTRDFFDSVRRHLTPDGIMSVTLGLSENYVNPQGKEYARSVRSTLLSVFRNVVFVPGERLTFMAGDAPWLAGGFSPGLLLGRLHERGVRTQFIQGYYLKDRMSPGRMADVLRWLERPGEVSTDERPVSSWRALIYATTRSGMGFTRLMAAAESLRWFVWFLILLIFLPVFFFFFGVMPVTGAAAAGFTQMIFQVAVIFAVQSAYGHAYMVIGLLSAGFMLGAWLGVLAVRFSWPGTSVISGAVMQALSACFFIFFMTFLPQGLFVLPLVTGVAGGIQLARYMILDGRGHSGRVYAADVMGAACGALLCGIFFLPVLGIKMTMMFIFLLNGALMLMFRFQPASSSSER